MSIMIFELDEGIWNSFQRVLELKAQNSNQWLSLRLEWISKGSSKITLQSILL